MARSRENTRTFARTTKSTSSASYSDVAATVGDLKMLLELQHGIPRAVQVLCPTEQMSPLKDDVLLSECGVTGEFAMTLSLSWSQLPGGMGCCQSKSNVAGQAAVEEIEARERGRSDSTIGEVYTNPLRAETNRAGGNRAVANPAFRPSNSGGGGAQALDAAAEIKQLKAQLASVTGNGGGGGSALEAAQKAARAAAAEIKQLKTQLATAAAEIKQLKTQLAASTGGGAAAPPPPPALIDHALAVQQGSAAAMARPANDRIKLQDEVRMLESTLESTTFDEKVLLYKTMLEARLLKAKDKIDALDKQAAVMAAAAAAASEAVCRLTAVKAKAATIKYNATVEALHADDPAAFDRLAQVAFDVNARSGPLEVGALVTFTKHGDPYTDQVQAQVCGEPDRKSGLVPIKVWAVANVTSKPYAEGFTVAAHAKRGELGGGAAPVQVVPQRQGPEGAEGSTSTASVAAEMNGTYATVHAATSAMKAEMDAVVARVNAGKPASEAVKLDVAPIKGTGSAARKLFSDYNGDVSKLLDVYRCAVRCPAPAQQAAVAEAIEADTALETLRFKNNMDLRKESPSGYRDTNASVRHVPSGVVFEVQTATGSMLDMKAASHEVYEGERSSALSTEYLGDANPKALARIEGGALRNVNFSGTSLAEGGRLPALLKALSAPSVRLVEWRMSACKFAKGLDLGETLLSPAVCNALGALIKVISFTGVGAVGRAAAVFAALAAGGCGKSLKVLELGANKLHGELPDGGGSGGGGGGAASLWSAFPKLRTLYLWDNELEGEIPKTLGALKDLETLYLSDNKLVGGIPRDLGHLIHLKTLQLQDNQLDGEIPKTLCALKDLETLSLSRNKFSGGISGDLGQLVHLKVLSLHSNQLSGEIPTTLCNLKNLEILKLGSNQFTNKSAFEKAIKKAVPSVDYR